MDKKLALAQRREEEEAGDISWVVVPLGAEQGAVASPRTTTPPPLSLSSSGEESSSVLHQVEVENCSRVYFVVSEVFCAIFICARVQTKVNCAQSM